MTDRRHGSGHDEEPVRSDFERFLLDSARSDLPAAPLGKRVLENLAYRARLERMARPRGRGTAALCWGAAAGLSLAALVAITLRPRPPATAPEVAPELGTRRSASVPSAPKPAVDACIRRARATGQAPLIDDFEDGDDAIAMLEGRKALWRWTRDTDAPGTAPALLPIPRPEPRRGNSLAIHVKGGKLRDWGAAVELTFQPSCYDASAYAGIGFTARGPGRVYVSPREVNVITVALGGTCQSDCFNGHVRKVDLDDRWRDYQVPWSEVEQRGYNQPPLDPSRLHDIAFLVRPEDTPYDLWLDDVRFVQR